MDALLRGIELFNNREFFLSHEVLEEVWRPERGPRRLFLQAIIHVAVGFHHYQRGNRTGASRQLAKALRKLDGYLPAFESVDTARLYCDALAVLNQIGASAALSVYPQIHPASACGFKSTPP